MTDKVISMLIGIIIMLGGWNLTKTFSLSTEQAVQIDKVNKLERQVEKMQDTISGMIKSDETIMEQHEDLFEILNENQTPRGYTYQ